MDKELLTVAELAERLKVSTQWVAIHTRKGTIPSIRVGRSYRYVLEDVVAVLEGRMSSYVIN